jgi:hypothetical protein
MILDRCAPLSARSVSRVAPETVLFIGEPFVRESV